MSSDKILVDEERTLGYGGNSTILTMSPKIRDYVKRGEKVRVRATIRGKDILIEVTKTLYNFDLGDVMRIAEKNGFQTRDAKTVGVVEIFEAKKQNLTLNYTKNTIEQASPAYVVLTAAWADLNYDKYLGYANKMKMLGDRFDAIIRPEGDLDAINVLSNPARYKTDVKDAFKMLQKKKKKIGLSVTLRFNNMKNTEEDVVFAINEITRLDSQLGAQK